MNVEQSKNEKAFTLVELLLVVTIIGILAGAVLVNMGGQSQRARETRAQMDIQAISVAIDRYEIDTGMYPDSSDGLEALRNDPGVQGWDGPYFQKTPTDPWGNEYQYVYPPNNAYNYDLYSLGADGQDSTEDDIVNWDEEAF